MNPKWRTILKVVSLSSLVVLSLLFLRDWFLPGMAIGEPVVAGSVDAPMITAITPDSASNDLDARVVITGTGFARELSGESVYTLPAISLHGYALENISWISSTELAATIPWGLDPGTYTITVTNPEGCLGYANIGSLAMTTMDGRVVLYAGTGVGRDQGIQRLASSSDTFINAGVYRNIIRITDFYLHRYLPLVRR